MKTLEFVGTLAEDGTIILPAGVADKLPTGESLYVTLQWGVDDAEDEAWLAAGRRCFAAAYAPEDDIYEDLLNEVPVR